MNSSPVDSAASDLCVQVETLHALLADPRRSSAERRRARHRLHELKLEHRAQLLGKNELIADSRGPRDGAVYLVHPCGSLQRVNHFRHLPKKERKAARRKLRLAKKEKG